MTELMGKRQAEGALWENYKPLLEFFYIFQNRTVDDIKDIMAKNCGFNRMKSQYESRFRAWELRKNFSGEEWREAKSMLDKRKLCGKSTIIEGSGRIIKRTQKRMGYHAYETTYERLRKQMNPDNPLHSKQMALIARTPSPEPCVNSGHDEVFQTLWHSSLQLVDETFNIGSQNQGASTREDLTKILCRAMSRMSLQTHSGRASGVGDFIRQRSFLRDELFDSPCGNAINIDQTITLRSGEAFMNLLKLAMYLISNNSARNTGIGPLIISMCQLPTNRSALEQLLRQKHSTIEAFAEGLLHYASKANDADLVRLLVRRGVDPNSNCGTCSNRFGGANVSRLHCAIYSGASDASIALLEAGADETKLFVGGSSCLMMCYDSNLLHLASTLLQRGANPAIPCPAGSRLRYALSRAAVYGGMPAVRTLAEHDPAAFRNLILAGESEAVMAAASVGNEAMMEYFFTYDISPMDCGSGLCAAAANGKTEMVQLLLSHGLSVDGTPGWLLEPRIGVKSPCASSALEVALKRGKLAAARVLLEHGASPEIGPRALNLLCERLMTDGVFQGMRNLSMRNLSPSELARRAAAGRFAEGVELTGFLLLQAGAQWDEETVVWLSLLQVAGAGAGDLVRCLILDRGANPNSSMTFKWGWTCKDQRVSALSAALYAGNDDLASFLLQHGADVNLPAGMDGHLSPLAASILMAMGGSRLDFRWARELLQRGADPRDPIALWAAAFTNSVDAYHLLSDACQRTHDCGVAEFARFAASEAICHGDLDFLRTIISRGIHLNAPIRPWEIRIDLSNIFSTPLSDPLHCAVRKANVEAIHLLLEAGADPNRAHLSNGPRKYDPEPILSCLPYTWPSSSVLCSMADALIRAGARVNFPESPTNRAPFMTEAAFGPVAVLDLLIRHGAPVDAVSSSEYRISRPLCMAVHLGRYKVVRKLLSENAHVFGTLEIKAPTPKTAIQIAASRGHLDILKLLLEAGAEEDDGSQFLSEYPLALRLAYRSGHRVIARYLQSYRSQSISHLGCNTDDEILKGVEDDGGDRKYWFRFWEDERYSGWRLIDGFGPEARAFIRGQCGDAPTDTDDSSSDRSDSASEGDDSDYVIDANPPIVPNEVNPVVSVENMGRDTETMNGLMDPSWEEFLNLDVDQSSPILEDGASVMDTSMEVPAEQISIEPIGQPVESNVLHQSMGGNGFDVSQMPAEIFSDWMNFSNGDNPFDLWGQDWDWDGLID